MTPTTTLTTEVPMPQSICALTGHDRKAIEGAVRKANAAAAIHPTEAEINALRDAVDICLGVLGVEVEDEGGAEPAEVGDWPSIDLVPCLAEGRHFRTQRHSAAVCGRPIVGEEEDLCAEPHPEDPSMPCVLPAGHFPQTPHNTSEEG